MSVSIEFETNNAAFADNPIDEITQILGVITTKLRFGLPNDGILAGKVMDSNGNAVGQYYINIGQDDDLGHD